MSLSDSPEPDRGVCSADNAHSVDPTGAQNAELVRGLAHAESIYWDINDLWESLDSDGSTPDAVMEPMTTAIEHLGAAIVAMRARTA